MTDAVSPRDLVASALRRERGRLGLSISEIARRAGIAKSTLSQLEAAEGNPSLETLWALGGALGVPFSHLVEPPRRAVQLIRAGDGPRSASATTDSAATLLSACPPGARRDVYRITAEPGAARNSEPHARGTVEHLILSTGRALAGPADDPVELAPGDCLSYPGDEPHVFDALEPGTSAVLVSEQV
jgi:transcriptional regulator with XRE-family HTH domain